MDTYSRSRQLRERFKFNANPFALREAAREGSTSLEEYFFKHPLFFDLLGNPDQPESIILFAARGAGKTTLRQMIELYCTEQRRPVENVLAVPYTKFSRTMMRAQELGRTVDVADHVDEILRCAVDMVVQTVVEARVKEFTVLSRARKSLFRAYVDEYSDLLQPANQGDEVDKLLKRIATGNDVRLDVDATELLSGDSTSIIASLPEWMQPSAGMLVQLQQQPPASLKQKSYIERMRGFLDLLVALDYRAIYVLVDRLEEGGKLTDPKVAAPFIQPLLNDLELLEQSNLAFKIFLPQSIEPLVNYRGDRLMVRNLGWNDDQLLELLQQRLQSFGESNTMRVFCDHKLGERMEDFSPRHLRVPYVDKMLVKSAFGLPRNLILRCRKLFDVYDKADHVGDISEYDLNEALIADLSKDDLVPAILPKDESISPPVLLETPNGTPTALSAPSVGEEAPAKGGKPHGLYVDENRRVWRDGELLGKELGPNELKMLEYLCQHRHKLCNNLEIMKAVWGTDVGGELFRTTIARLRLAVEPNKSKPRFVITRRGLGTELQDG